MNFGQRGKRDRDLDQEIRAHLEMAARDHIERGESPEGAATSVRREFGNATLIKEVTRDVWGWTAWERLVQDLRYSFRVLRKSPGFAAVAILSLALGIGVNTAIFSLIDAVMLKSLPVREADRLVIVGDPTRTGGLSEGSGRSDMFSYPFFQRFRAQQQVFMDVYASGRCEHLDVSLANGVRAGSEEQRIRGRFVSGNFFSVLGLHPSIGREFTEEETRIPGAAPVIVISDGFAQRTFGDRRAALDQKLIVNGAPFTVVGIMPRDFSGDIVGAPTDIWFPMTMQAQANPGHEFLKDPAVCWMILMGRLKPGVTLAQADGPIQALSHRLLEELYKGKDSDEGLHSLLKEKIQVTSGAKGFSRMRHDFAAPLMILMGIVGLVLMICCANVANLQLARAVARGREMSLRLAVGAGQGRLVRQLLTESLALSLMGAVLGLVFASWVSHLLLRMVSSNGPTVAVPLDARVLLFTAAIAVFAGLLFGIAPVLQARRLDLIAALRENKGQPSTFAKGFGKALVVLQIVFSVVLLVSAGLFIRTLRNLEGMDVGYRRNNLVLAELDFKTAGYQGQRIDPLVRSLLERVRQVPGVIAATASENGLFSGTDSEGVNDVEGFVARSLADKQNRYDRVAPNYFSTIGARIVSGRDIGPQDIGTSPKVAVINEKMAQFYFPRENPIGRHIVDSQDPSDKHPVAITIVGVVRDVKESELRQPTPRRFYMPMFEHRPGEPIDSLKLEIRTRGSSARMLDSIRRAIKQVDPRLPILDLSSAGRLIDDDLQQEQLVAKLSSFFGLLAALLAAVGLYGVMSYLTLRRTTEIGIRMALGARGALVLRMVLAETFKLVGIGLVIGVGASLLFGSFLGKALFGLSAFDPASIFSAAALIALAAALATWLPARRASHVDPISALRYE